MKAESHTEFFPSYIITLQAGATVEARRVFCFSVNEHMKFFSRIIIVVCGVCFWLLVVIALSASAAPPGFFQLLQAAPRETLGSNSMYSYLAAQLCWSSHSSLLLRWQCWAWTRASCCSCAISKFSLFICRVGRTCISVALNLQF